MKVLFVSSGNLKAYGIAPFIKVQGESLREKLIDITYFTITGRGFVGYLSNVKTLREMLKSGEFDIIHAHFTLSAWVVILAYPKAPIVLSLMGTDAYGRVEKLVKNRNHLNLLTFSTILIQPFVKKIISKSPNIEKFVWQKKKSHLLPNGVNVQEFYPTKYDFREELGLSKDKKYVLFLGNPKDPRKNFDLLKVTYEKLALHNIEIVAPFPIPHAQVFKYLNSVDVLVMCSFEEGSPNVVKEGMACNCKGVFTDVGDVRYLVENTPGYAISEFNATDLAQKIFEVMDMESCYGRQRLLDLGLDLPMVADKLINIYQEAIN
ncbi:glycosyltransferase [Pontibacter virosus]|uniref:Glycosyltransferase involved in cell wall biosynthesis n=1 Tax=Pontibacter virosus TaxID=1765052 RepID=A0A2U1AK32_9BACT|nr:glycosyltransferase [Pontibacter virosus]PVY36671.1 glycosyltransferase involved in cell wall biosynthesis [Pontibacter virosus]